MGCGRQSLQHCAYGGWQRAQVFELGSITRKLRLVGQLLMDQQIGDFLEITALRDLQNIVATIVQIVAGAPYSAERGVACCYSRERNGFFGLGRKRQIHFLSLSSRASPNSASSL